MTTTTTRYGTIPTIHPEPPSIFLQAKDRFISDIGTPKPWPEMFKTESLTLPSSFSTTFHRIRTNIFFFRANYIIIILSSIVITLLWNPFMLLSAFLMMGAWIFYSYLGNGPVLLWGFLITENVVMTFLVVSTLGALYLTNIKESITCGIFLGGAVDLAHAGLRRTDDLGFVGNDGENCKLVNGSKTTTTTTTGRLPVKRTAPPSSSSSSAS